MYFLVINLYVVVIKNSGHLNIIWLGRVVKRVKSLEEFSINTQSMEEGVDN